MTKWILGTDLIKKKKIQPVELFTEYIQGQGLMPYDQAGRAISPADLISILLEKKLVEADHGVDSFQVEGCENDDEAIDFYVSRSLTVEISNANILQNLEGVEWSKFELPDSFTETTHFLALLRQSLFSIEELGQLQQKQKPEEKKLTDDQRRRVACRKEAEKIWADDPNITIADMILSDELNLLCENRIYAEKTMRNWINDLCPNRDPGRRPKDK